MRDKDFLDKVANSSENVKYFFVLASLYVATIIMSITVSARLFPLHLPMSHFTILLTGGTWTIPLSFFIQDITTEVYGYAKSRQLILMTLAIVTGYVAYTEVITFLPIPSSHNIDAAYNTVFRALPRHLLALAAAVMIGNFVNDYIISKLKIRFQGRYLPLRFILATIVGEGILQLVGTSIAWGGKLGFLSEILPFVAFSYCYKIAFEILLMPFSVIICKCLKKAEGIDVYDTNVNYNPLAFWEKRKAV